MSFDYHLAQVKKKREEEERQRKHGTAVHVIGAAAPTIKSPRSQGSRKASDLRVPLEASVRVYDVDLRKEVNHPDTPPPVVSEEEEESDMPPETPRTMMRSIREKQQELSERIERSLQQATKNTPVLPPPPDVNRNTVRIMLKDRMLSPPPPPPPDPGISSLSDSNKCSTSLSSSAKKTTTVSSPRKSTVELKHSASNESVSSGSHSSTEGSTLAKPRTVPKSPPVTVSAQKFNAAEQHTAFQPDPDAIFLPRDSTAFSPEIRKLLHKKINVWGSTPDMVATQEEEEREEEMERERQRQVQEAMAATAANMTEPADNLELALRSFMNVSAAAEDSATRHFLDPPKELRHTDRYDAAMLLFGDVEPGSRPGSGVSSQATRTPEQLSWDDMIRNGSRPVSGSSLENSREKVPPIVVDSNSSAGALSTSPRQRRASGVSDGNSPDEDQTDLRTQLVSIKRITGDQLCRRGICCYRTESACGGRVNRTTMLEVSSKGGTIVRRPRGGSTVGAAGGYVHRGDALDPESEQCLMEYAAAVCFLIACERTPPDMGRRSDDLLDKVDIFVDSHLDDHPLRSNRSESKHRFMVKDYLARKGVPKLCVSNGALIAAALYLGIAKLDDLDRYLGPWLPIYVYDGQAAVVTPNMPATPEQAAASLTPPAPEMASPRSSPLSTSSKSTPHLLRVESKQEKRSSSGASTLSRLFGSSRGSTSGDKP